MISLLPESSSDSMACSAEHVRGFAADRPVAEARLTEPAAADAAAENFEVRPVVDDLGRRHDGLRREIGLVRSSTMRFVTRFGAPGHGVMAAMVPSGVVNYACTATGT